MTWDHDALLRAAREAEDAVPRLEGLADPVVARRLTERLLEDPAGLMEALKRVTDEDVPPQVAEAGATLEAFLLDEVEDLPARAPDLAAWLTGADLPVPQDRDLLRAQGLTHYLVEVAGMPEAPRPGWPSWAWPLAAIAGMGVAALLGTVPGRPPAAVPVPVRVGAPAVTLATRADPGGWLGAPVLATEDTTTESARDTLEREARQGNSRAARELGLLHLKVPRPDLPQAVDWLRRASTEGDAKATRALAWVLSEGPSRMQDVPQALGLYRQAAADGDPDAHYRLGVMLFEGRAGEADQAAGAEHIRVAALAGVHRAQLDLAHLYAQGAGVEKSLLKSFDWLRRAAEELPRAATELGRMYERGEGVGVDHEQALRWYRSAATDGEATALYRIGEMTLLGHGTDADPEAAKGFFHAAAEAGHIEAPARLAELEGRPAPTDQPPADRAP
jgi:TPR repeat protein